MLKKFKWLILGFIIFLLSILLFFDFTSNFNKNNKLAYNKLSVQDYYKLSSTILYEIDINKTIKSDNSILEPGSVDIGNLMDFNFELGKYYFMDISGSIKAENIRYSVDFYTYNNNQRTEDFFFSINSIYNIIQINEEYNTNKLILSYYGSGTINIDKIRIYEVLEVYDHFINANERQEFQKVNFDLLKGLMTFNSLNLNEIEGKKVIENLKNKRFLIQNNLPEIDFSDGVIWDDTLNDNRTYLLSLHGFRSFSTYAKLFMEHGDPDILKNYYYLIDDWIDSNTYVSKENNLAYNDMALSLRVFSWLYFYDLAKDYLTIEQNQKIINNLYYQVNLLREPQLYALGNNHGLFQDISYLLYHYYFNGKDNDAGDYADKVNDAFDNIKFYFNTVVSPKGVHLEHSPSYHLMIAKLIEQTLPIFESIDLNTQQLKRTHENMGDYATHILKPDGVIPQIGDSERTKSSSQYWDSEEYLYATTNCKDGIQPRLNNVVYPESGYAIFRDSWDKCEKATYILFYNHYSSYYHKHSDELGLWIYRDGDIIRESGKAGYQYTDPYTKYAYSSWGHNSLIVNNSGLVEQRNIPNDYNYAGTYIENYSLEDPNNVWVSGVNERYEDVIHKRQVNYQKNDNLIMVNDNVTSKNKNNYTLLWHLSSEINPVLNGKTVKLYRDNFNIMDVDFVSKNNFSLNIIKGQTNPNILGWHFDKSSTPETNYVIRIDFNDIQNTDLTTSFKFKY